MNKDTIHTGSWVDNSSLDDQSEAGLFNSSSEDLDGLTVVDEEDLNKDTFLEGVTEEEIEKIRLKKLDMLSNEVRARLTKDQINNILDREVTKVLKNKSDESLVKEISEAIQKDRLNKINNAKSLKSLSKLGIMFLHEKIFFKKEEVNYYSAFSSKNKEKFNGRKELIKAFNKKEKEIKEFLVQQQKENIENIKKSKKIKYNKILKQLGGENSKKLDDGSFLIKDGANDIYQMEIKELNNKNGIKKYLVITNTTSLNKKTKYKKGETLFLPNRIDNIKILSKKILEAMKGKTTHKNVS